MPKADVASFMSEADLDKSGSLSFGEFLNLMDRAKNGGNFSGKGSELVKTLQKGVDTVKVKGDFGGNHSYTEEEKQFYGAFINNALRDDPDCAHLLPINLEGNDLFEAVSDGILPCKLINVAAAGTIDPRVINKKKNMMVHHKTENQTLAINSARSIGCQIVGISAMDVIDGINQPHLVLSFLWQLVKVAVLSHISLKEHPFLVRLLEGDETVEAFMKLAPEKILLRWMNFLLNETECKKRVKNFSSDIKDSVAYTYLLHRMVPAKCDTSAVSLDDMDARASKVISNSCGIGIPKLMSAGDISSGNGKLNLMFVAELFNTYPCLEPLTEEEALEISETDMLDFAEGTREERVFRLWINTLEIPEVFVTDLYEDVKSGYMLLRVIDSVFPGNVDLKKANKTPGTVFKRLENCGMVCEASRKVGLKLVGVEGKDIEAGTPKFVLSLCWQLWRSHIGNMLAQVTGTGKRPDEKEILAWANGKVKAAGYDSQIKDFKDKSIATGQYLVQLLAAVKKSAVDFDVIAAGSTEEEQKSNSEYIVSVARKIGCVIFNVPDDIVEVRPKMLMVLVSMIMLVDLQGA